MFEKNMRISYLLDFYGEVLDEHTGSVMRSYYNDDLSLAEIADGLNISRQGVRHLVKKGEDQLLFLEERLGLAAHYLDLQKACDMISDVCEYLDGIKTEEADRKKEALTEASRIITKRLT